jgi:hypothetical protein
MMSKITTGHLYGLKHYKARKFGYGSLAWRVFEQWAAEIIGHECIADRLQDSEAKRLIEAMKRLHDAPVAGQGGLFGD